MHNLDFKTIAKTHQKAFGKLLDWMRVSSFTRDHILKSVYRTGDSLFKADFHGLFPVNRSRDLFDFFDSHGIFINVIRFVKKEDGNVVESFKTSINDSFEFWAPTRIEVERASFIKAFELLNK